MRAVGLFIVAASLIVFWATNPADAQVNALAGGKAGPEVADESAPKREKLWVEIKVESKPITPNVVYQFSREVGRGRLVLHSNGKLGELKETYAHHFKGDRLVEKELLESKRTEPEPMVYYMGYDGYPASRSSFTRGEVRTMQATCYDPSAGLGKRATFKTRTGLKAEYGIVAVDPNVIKLGTLVYVEGYGFAIAADTGGAIKGNRIDLCVPTYREAMRFGRRDVRVHILK